jgi:AAA15 family ATPase/GTPase
MYSAYISTNNVIYLDQTEIQMLIEFSVTNFRSIFERQTLSLAMASGGEHRDTNVFQFDGANKFDLLRSAAIYGPNASGKSNLLIALRTMQDCVRESATKLTSGDKLPAEVFKLDPEARKLPSEFEVTIIAKGVRYQYGFSISQERVEEEWLLAYPKGRPQQWFTREWDKVGCKYRWEIGSALIGEKQLWQKSTRDNSLFLSTAVQLNCEQLKPIFDWFDDILHTVKVGGWGSGYSASLCETKGKKELLLNFLRAADLDIEDIGVKSEEFSEKKLPQDMPQQLKSHLSAELKGHKIFEITTFHKDSEGQPVPFDFLDESDGTQKLFNFAGPWLDSLEHGSVLFVDELHDNLHPKLVSFLIELFHNDLTNPKNAQLVFTTHETSILSQDVFRRDQIWFCEKSDKKSTSLFSLTDFSPRKGRENLEAAYLSGRYGALPYVRKIRGGS